MKLFVTVKQQNPNFNKEYAEQYHGGNESECNWKDNWSCRIKIQDNLKQIKIIENGVLNFDGEKDSQNLNYTISNLKMIQGLTNENETIQIAALSNILIEKTHSVFNEEYDTTRFYFYLKPTDEYIHPASLVYIAKSDIPKELLIEK